MQFCIIRVAEHRVPCLYGEDVRIILLDRYVQFSLGARQQSDYGVPVSSSFRTFIVDQLSRVVPQLRARGMFGGVGIYAGQLFFALIADDTLFLKVDDSNRPEFERLGMRPFQPYGEGGEVMQYYQVPAEFLEDPEALRPWAEKAIAVAARKKMKGKRGRRGGA